MLFKVIQGHRGRYQSKVRTVADEFWTLCVFQPPFGELRDNVRCSFWAHRKALSGLPISDN